MYTLYYAAFIPLFQTALRPGQLAAIPRAWSLRWLAPSLAIAAALRPLDRPGRRHPGELRGRQDGGGGPHAGGPARLPLGPPDRLRRRARPGRLELAGRGRAAAGTSGACWGCWSAARSGLGPGGWPAGWRSPWPRASSSIWSTRSRRPATSASCSTPSPPSCCWSPPGLDWLVGRPVSPSGLARTGAAAAVALAVAGIAAPAGSVLHHTALRRRRLPAADRSDRGPWPPGRRHPLRLSLASGLPGELLPDPRPGRASWRRRKPPGAATSPGCAATWIRCSAGARRVWFPAHQKHGAILEQQVETYLSQAGFPVANDWFGDTRLYLYSCRRSGRYAAGGAALRPPPRPDSGLRWATSRWRPGVGVVPVELAMAAHRADHSRLHGEAAAGRLAGPHLGPARQLSGRRPPALLDLVGRPGGHRPARPADPGGHSTGHLPGPPEPVRQGHVRGAQRAGCRRAACWDRR